MGFVRKGNFDEFGAVLKVGGRQLGIAAAVEPETRIEAIVNLASARVLGMPGTAARRREPIASRVGVTTAVVDLMRRLQQAPRVLVSASAVGFYGASPQASFEPRDEASPPRPGEFQSNLCAAIEHDARRADALGVRVVRLRLGVVLGRGDGAYPMLALAARLGLGAVLGSGRQPAPWIHLDDAVGMIRFAMVEERLDGAVNAVAPDTPTQERFTRALAASFGRRVWIRVPEAPMRVLMGGRWGRCCGMGRTWCRGWRWRRGMGFGMGGWRGRWRSWLGEGVG